MEQSNKPEEVRASSFSLNIKKEDLFHEDHLVVSFEDLFELYTFNKLETSLMRCWTL